MKNVKRYLSLLIVVAVTIMPTLALAESIPKENDLPSKNVKDMAKELEYVFTEILVKNNKTNKYIVNERELKNSTYTKKEKKGIVEIAHYMNNKNSKLVRSNAFTRCWADAVGISGNVLDKFLGYIEDGNYVGAAGVLSAVGIFLSPVSIFIFTLTCGAKPVE